ncbi:MAG TPA: BON domain-containing protein, partial [Lacipirellulaceae bacterium]|nr:BON domain-containing protein [Lacipirellulaceae bacterium]
FGGGFGGMQGGFGGAMGPGPTVMAPTFFGTGPMVGGQMGPLGGSPGQRAFIGRDAAGVQANMQAQFGSPQQSGRFFADMIQNFNDLREQRRRWRDRDNAEPPVRVQLRPAFDLPTAPPSSAVGVALERRLGGMLASRGEGAGAVQVALTGRGAVLTGQVATEHDRALIEQVARLEPGIDVIENRLTVGPASAATGSAQTDLPLPPPAATP